ncbi:hypothetical protein N7540_004343 [Penicillium herquei]|nr:hypothetical protein N7540_004343 [Penicillium herquei]
MPFRHRSFQFVASDVNGLPQNRKKAQRACPTCRKRKRRCTHGIGTSQRPKVSGDTQTRGTLSPPVDGEEEPTPNSPRNSQVDEHQNAQAPPQGACIDGESCCSESIIKFQVNTATWRCRRLVISKKCIFSAGSQEAQVQFDVLSGPSAIFSLSALLRASMFGGTSSSQRYEGASQDLP